MSRLAEKRLAGQSVGGGHGGRGTVQGRKHRSLYGMIKREGIFRKGGSRRNSGRRERGAQSEREQGGVSTVRERGRERTAYASHPGRSDSATMGSHSRPYTCGHGVGLAQPRRTQEPPRGRQLVFRFVTVGWLVQLAARGAGAEAEAALAFVSEVIWLLKSPISPKETFGNEEVPCEVAKCTAAAAPTAAFEAKPPVKLCSSCARIGEGRRGEAGVGRQWRPRQGGNGGGGAGKGRGELFSDGPVRALWTPNSNSLSKRAISEARTALYVYLPRTPAIRSVQMTWHGRFPQISSQAQRGSTLPQAFPASCQPLRLLRTEDAAAGDDAKRSPWRGGAAREWEPHLKYEVRLRGRPGRSGNVRGRVLVPSTRPPL